MRIPSAILGLFGVVAACQPPEPDRPGELRNVLLIVVDDLNTTAISSYGSAVSSTPNIDRLAAEGVRFTRAYSQFPVCGPSRASMMTGYYPHATGAFGYVSGRDHIGPNRLTWPQLFAEEGFYTARVSKIFHMDVPADILSGSDGVDDESSWTERFNSQGPEWQASGEGELVQNNPNGTLPVAGGNVMTIVKADGDDGDHSDGRTAETAVALLDEQADEPFFLAVGFVRPHVPFVAPRAYFEPYPHSSIELPPRIGGDLDDIPEAGINYVTTAGAEMSPEQEQKAIAAYFASVAYSDAQIGKLLDALDDLGLAGNTLVIFTSDHGFHLGEHGFWMKKGLHEESVHVPLVIRDPRGEPGVRDAFVELLDLYPTSAELLGLMPPAAIQGKSLAGVLRDPYAAVRDDAFSVTDGGTSFLLRDDRWAYLQYGEDAARGRELYDMVADPGQFVNLASSPGFAAEVAGLQARLTLRLAEASSSDLSGGI